jgi:hypothetical protein
MIDVRKGEGNEFVVTVTEGRGSTTHRVNLDDSYYRKLTGGSVTKEDLIRKSFEFLLQRESKESILGRFDLPVIGRYFPEYERTISS